MIGLNKFLSSGCRIGDVKIIFGRPKLHLEAKKIRLKKDFEILVKQNRINYKLIKLLKRANKPLYFLESEFKFTRLVQRIYKSNLKILIRELAAGPDVKSILQEFKNSNKKFNVFFCEGFLNVVSEDRKSVYKFKAVERFTFKERFENVRK